MSTSSNYKKSNLISNPMSLHQIPHLKLYPVGSLEVYPTHPTSYPNYDDNPTYTTHPTNANYPTHTYPTYPNYQNYANNPIYPKHPTNANDPTHTYPTYPNYQNYANNLTYTTHPTNANYPTYTTFPTYRTSGYNPCPVSYTQPSYYSTQLPSYPTFLPSYPTYPISYPTYLPPPPTFHPTHTVVHPVFHPYPVYPTSCASGYSDPAPASPQRLPARGIKRGSVATHINNAKRPRTE